MRTVITLAALLLVATTAVAEDPACKFMTTRHDWVADVTGTRIGEPVAGLAWFRFWADPDKPAHYDASGRYRVSTNGASPQTVMIPGGRPSTSVYADCSFEMLSASSSAIIEGQIVNRNHMKVLITDYVNGTTLVRHAERVR